MSKLRLTAYLMLGLVIYFAANMMDVWIGWGAERDARITNALCAAIYVSWLIGEGARKASVPRDDGYKRR